MLEKLRKVIRIGRKPKAPQARAPGGLSEAARKWLKKRGIDPDKFKYLTDA